MQLITQKTILYLFRPNITLFTGKSSIQEKYCWLFNLIGMVIIEQFNSEFNEGFGNIDGET